MTEENGLQNFCEETHASKVLSHKSGYRYTRCFCAFWMSVTLTGFMAES